VCRLVAAKHTGADVNNEDNGTVPNSEPPEIDSG